MAKPSEAFLALWKQIPRAPFKARLIIDGGADVRIVVRESTVTIEHREDGQCLIQFCGNVIPEEGREEINGVDTAHVRSLLRRHVSSELNRGPFSSRVPSGDIDSESEDIICEFLNVLIPQMADEIDRRKAATQSRTKRWSSAAKKQMRR